MTVNQQAQELKRTNQIVTTQNIQIEDLKRQLAKEKENLKQALDSHQTAIQAKEKALEDQRASSDQLKAKLADLQKELNETITQLETSKKHQLNMPQDELIKYITKCKVSALMLFLHNGLCSNGSKLFGLTSSLSLTLCKVQ